VNIQQIETVLGALDRRVVLGYRAVHREDYIELQVSLSNVPGMRSIWETVETSRGERKRYKSYDAIISDISRIAAFDKTEPSYRIIPEVSNYDEVHHKRRITDTANGDDNSKIDS